MGSSFRCLNVSVIGVRGRGGGREVGAGEGVGWGWGEKPQDSVYELLTKREVSGIEPGYVFLPAKRLTH